MHKTPHTRAIDRGISFLDQLTKITIAAAALGLAARLVWAVL
ncbi:hypothetical protein [Yoonia sp.]|nr:hypothetical protein [Yoonia sp.]